jgi:hypothetical protein
MKRGLFDVFLGTIVENIFACSGVSVGYSTVCYFV